MDGTGIPWQRAGHTGIAGLLYVTTGVHGGHVLVGMLCILCYVVQGYSWSVYCPASTDTTHGLLSIVLY